MSISALCDTHTLLGHTSPVNTLAFSANGNLLVSGGDDAKVDVWDVKTGELIQQIFCPFNGPVTAITWVRLSQQHDENSSFAYGCIDGTVHVFHRLDQSSPFVVLSSTVVHKMPVHDMCFDPNHNRIATAGDGVVRVWNIQGLGALWPVGPDPPVGPHTTRSVHFIEDGSCIVVYFLESHEVKCYTIDPWGLKWSKELPTRIGYARADIGDCPTVFVSNLENGVDQYRLPSMERIQTFKQPLSIRSKYVYQSYPLPAVGWILVGGDSGVAFLFDIRSGAFLRNLVHATGNSLIQVVAAHQYEDGHGILATATSGSDFSIKIWVSPAAMLPERSSKVTEPSTALLKWWQVLALMLASTVFSLVCGAVVLMYYLDLLPSTHIVLEATTTLANSWFKR